MLKQNNGRVSKTISYYLVTLIAYEFSTFYQNIFLKVFVILFKVLHYSIFLFWFRFNLDIDECNEKTDGCQHSCQNTIGSYLCQCNSGTNLNADRRTCDDIDECLNSNTCSSNANCYNIYGSFRCECKFGYSGNGSYCQGNLIFFDLYCL